MAKKVKRLNETELMNWRKYHIPGCSPIHRMKVNAIHLSIANSKVHEMAKCSLAYDLLAQGHKIITEAVENQTNLRRDLVSISSGNVWEIEDSKSSRGKRHPKNINVIWYDLGRERTREEAEICK